MEFFLLQSGAPGNRGDKRKRRQKKKKKKRDEMRFLRGGGEGECFCSINSPLVVGGRFVSGKLTIITGKKKKKKIEKIAKNCKKSKKGKEKVTR